MAGFPYDVLSGAASARFHSLPPVQDLRFEAGRYGLCRIDLPFTASILIGNNGDPVWTMGVLGTTELYQYFPSIYP